MITPRSILAQNKSKAFLRSKYNSVDREQLYSGEGKSVYLPFSENKVLLVPNGSSFELGWTDQINVPFSSEPLYLGASSSHNLFAVSVDTSQNGRKDDVYYSGREALNRLETPEDQSLFLWAHGLIKHQQSFKYCPSCSFKLSVKNYGRFMNCKTCEKDFYPRVDPVIITLLIHQDSCLLCRLPTSPIRRYSCVAGFLEPGESIEECVRREASEEVGVNVISVKYVLSKPWPTEMGSNLMIGCRTEVDSKNFTINKLELEDAKWFSKKEISTYLSKLSDEYILPEHYTTANKLLNGWIRE